MGTFKSQKRLVGAAPMLSQVANGVASEFRADGYEVCLINLSSGGAEVSITKGGLFKGIMGLRTALKIQLIPFGNDIDFEAGVGIFGQQAIPTIISMFFFWPVLVTQIWGMVQQSKLDDRALHIAESIIASPTIGTTMGTSTNASKFCTQCGTKNPANAKFCCNCGKSL